MNGKIIYYDNLELPLLPHLLLHATSAVNNIITRFWLLIYNQLFYHFYFIDQKWEELGKTVLLAIIVKHGAPIRE